MLFVRVHRDAIGFASGMELENAGPTRWREAVAGDEGADLASTLERLGAAGAEVVGEGRRTVPKPHPPDHPRTDRLRHTGFQVRWQRPTPKVVTSARFVDWCARRLTRVEPVHRWLKAHVAP